MEIETPWDFVQKFYPDYHRSDEIALADDLQKLLDEEINGHAEKILHRDYGGDINNPQIQSDYDRVHRLIYEAAIEEAINCGAISGTTSNPETPWDFVAEFYPNYYSSDVIALADDLSKLIHGEINGDAETMLDEDYGGDIKNPQIQIDYDNVHRLIYEAAIEEVINCDAINGIEL